MTPTRASGSPTLRWRRPCRSPPCPQARSTAIPTGRRTTPRSSTPPVPRSPARSPSGSSTSRTGDQSEFVPAAPGQDRPTWSPDGTKIAYGSQGSIWVKDVAPGSQPVQITNGATDQRPVWSPDGNTLYFNRGAAGNRDLYQVTPVAPTGTVTGVLTTPTDDWQPAVSPDGKRLCFLRGGQDNTADIFTVNVDGNGRHPAVDHPGRGRPQLRLVARRLAGALHARRVRRGRPRVDGQERQRPPAPHQPERGGALRRQRRLGHELLAQVRQQDLPGGGERLREDHAGMRRPGCRQRRRSTGARADRPPGPRDRLEAVARQHRRHIGQRPGRLHAEAGLPRHRQLHLHRQRRGVRLRAGQDHRRRGHGPRGSRQHRSGAGRLEASRPGASGSRSAPRSRSGSASRARSHSASSARAPVG